MKEIFEIKKNTMEMIQLESICSAAERVVALVMGNKAIPESDLEGLERLDDNNNNNNNNRQRTVLLFVKNRRSYSVRTWPKQLELESKFDLVLSYETDMNRYWDNFECSEAVG